MDEFADLLPHFIDDTGPLISAVAEDLLVLESAWEAGQRDATTVATARGRLHTIKGNAGMMGLTGLQTVAHVLEDLCALGDRQPSRVLAALLVEISDELLRLFGSLDDGHESDKTADATPRTDLLARARAALQGVLAEPAEPATPAEPAEPATPATTGLELASAARPSARDDGSIRVSFRRLDELLELVGEAVITHSSVAAAGNPEALEEAVTSLGKTLRLVQNALMEARLLPVSTLFGQFGRYVRDLAKQRGQALRLETRGGDTPIDKTIIDRLAEPLGHIIRNAVAHGVEPAEERRAAGKPAHATIVLAAEVRSGRVAISVSDDGRGLDLGAIASKARHVGLEVDGLSDDELRRLIFQPGFSTAGEVSTLAGRGIGLDVVARSVASLGGRVDVRSRQGRGATFILDLPLTLAVVKGLLTQIEGESLIFPLSYVEEIVRLEPNALHDVGGEWTMSWRDGLLPVADAATRVGFPGPSRRRRFCVVVASGARRRGLLVDELLGHQDIVVKALDDEIEKPEAVTGATIVADGRVVLIADCARLVEARTAPTGPLPPKELVA